MSHVKLYFLSGILSLVFTGIAYSQDDISVRSGEYEVFYSAFNSSFLSPEVAGAIGVARRKNGALVNISILKHLFVASEVSTPNDKKAVETVSVEAKKIEGTVFNLIHRQPLVFQEVVEPTARYYLAPFKIANDDELMVLEIDVWPKGANSPIKVKFQRQFFHN